jgi:hypothetical protein
MGEKGNVAAAAAAERGGGRVDDALDTGRVVIEKTTDVFVEGAAGAATGVVSDRVRGRVQPEETKESGVDPGDPPSAS